MIVSTRMQVMVAGVVRVIEGNRFSLGELDGSRSERIEALSRVMMGAGFKSPVSRDIRSEIWLKLWGNLTFNPISALTHATLEDICRFPPTRELAAQMMREAQAVGERLGVEFKISLDKRIASGAIDIIHAGDGVRHRDLVTNAWTEFPLSDVLKRLPEYQR